MQRFHWCWRFSRLRLYGSFLRLSSWRSPSYWFTSCGNGSFSIRCDDVGYQLESHERGVLELFVTSLGCIWNFLAEIIVLVGGRVVFDKPAEVAAAITTEGNTLQLGRLLYTEYLYAFELAAVILLVAIVGRYRINPQTS